MSEREFNITPKSSASWLKVQNWHVLDTKISVGEDVLGNVLQLAPGLDLSKILPYFKHRDMIGVRKGLPVLQNIHVPTIGSTAGRMDWDMHQPEVVYMSGALFAEVLETRRTNIEQLLEGRMDSYGQEVIISYANQEIAEEKKNKLREELDEVEVKLSLLNVAIYDYIQQTPVLSDRRYVDILRELLHVTNAKPTPNYRDRVLKALKEGGIESAEVLLKKTKN